MNNFMSMNIAGKAWTAFWAVTFLLLFSQVVSTGDSADNFRALDFRMRYNEVECVRSGKDPYLVWNGTIITDKYTPWDFYLTPADNMNLVHAYPPWEYAWMLPLTCMPRGAAEMVFRALSWFGILFIVGCSFLLGYKARQAAWSGFAVTTAVLLVSPAMCFCLFFLNFGILITAAVLMALLCHHRGHDCLAGVFWAFALVKPQLGVLFIVTLLVRWKWRTLLVTGLITLSGTLVSAALCHRSPIDMVLAITNYSHGQFMNVGFIRHELFAILASSFGETALIACSAFGGIMLCVLLGWLLRPSKDVLEWVMPPVFLSTLWVVARNHDQTISAIMILGLALAAVRATKLRPFLCDVLLVFLISLRDLDDLLRLPISVTQILALILLFVRIMCRKTELKVPNGEDTSCRSPYRSMVATGDVLNADSINKELT